MNKRQHSKAGFTIIELSLAMTFVSILMIFIAVLVINMTGIYTKGVTIKDLNSTGRIIIDDITRSIAASPPIILNDKTTGAPLYYKSTTNGGRFCTGVYSYIWNNVVSDAGGKTRIYGRDTGDTGANEYAGNPSENDLRKLGLLKPLRLVKVMDRSRVYCIEGDKKVELPADLAPGADTGIGTKPIELLGTNDTDLAVYDFKVFDPAQSKANRQVFYSVSFVLGTVRGMGLNGAMTASTACKPPSDDAGEFNYCAINKFNVSMRTTSSTLNGN